MQDRWDVTVITAAYNCEKYLEECVRSVQAQALPPQAHIIVDDGSTDNGSNIAKQYLTDRDQLISQPNAGPGAARNRGIAAARGEYLAFIDADDEWVPCFLQRAIDAFRRAQGNLDVVSQGVISLPTNVVRTPHRELSNQTLRLTPGSPGDTLSHILSLLGVGRIVTRTSLVLRLGGFYAADRVTRGEDTWLFHLLAISASVYADPRVGLIYHADAGQLYGDGRIGYRDPTLPPVVRCQQDLLRRCPPELRRALRAQLIRISLTTATRLLSQQRWRLGVPLLARALFASLGVPATWRVAVVSVASVMPSSDERAPLLLTKCWYRPDQYTPVLGTRPQTDRRSRS